MPRNRETVRPQDQAIGLSAHLWAAIEAGRGTVRPSGRKTVKPWNRETAIAPSRKPDLDEPQPGQCPDENTEPIGQGTDWTQI